MRRAPDSSLDQPERGIAPRAVPPYVARDERPGTTAADPATDTSDLLRAEPRNRVLRALPLDEYARLLPHLEPVTVAPLEVLADGGRPLRHVYFPETGIVSVLRQLRDGTLIEAYAVGRDGIIGVPTLLGDPGSPAGTVLGEVPGLCRRMPVEALRALLPALPAFEDLLRRLVLVLLDHVQQAVACNSLHSVEQRCARWLLQAHDGVGTESFALTHEVIAQLLAVRRAGVTMAAGELQKAGLISYTRGRVRVLDRTGLEAAACECYGVIRGHAERLLR